MTFTKTEKTDAPASDNFDMELSQWLAAVERILIALFGSDKAILSKCQDKIMIRDHLAASEGSGKDPVNRAMAAGEAATGQLTPDQAQRTIALFERVKLKRSALAGALQRPETVPWQQHPSDCYGSSVRPERDGTVGGLGAYWRRVRYAGDQAHLLGLFRKRSASPERQAFDDPSREARAEQAAAMLDGKRCRCGSPIIDSQDLCNPCWEKMNAQNLIHI